MAETETLEQFLIERSKAFGTEDAIRELLRRLEPYRRAIADGRLNLLPPSQRLRKRAAQAIASASGLQADRIYQVPMRRRRAAIEHLEVPDPECRFDVTMRLGTPPSEINREGRYRHHHEVMDPDKELTLGFRHDVPDRLMFLFDRDLWKPLEPVIGESVTKWLWRKMSALAWPDVMRMNHAVLFIHIGYTLVGAVEAAAASQAWVELLPQAMPLGHQEGHPDRWFLAVG